MSEHRLLFSKEGRAKYISHLDLMHTMQRVFLRAGVKIRHTEGFNPHPYISFALPLSVGHESVCELMDFDLADDTSLAALPGILNTAMPEGITAIKAYGTSKKFKELRWLKVEGRLYYDGGVPKDAVSVLNSFFARESIVIAKKSKKGISDMDIVPCISSISFTETGKTELRFSAVVAAQNPSLNPELLAAAIRQHLPELAPDFASFRRLEVLGGDMEVFR